MRAREAQTKHSFDYMTLKDIWIDIDWEAIEIQDVDVE